MFDNIKEQLRKMSEEESKLTWSQFLKKYSKIHNITYAQAMVCDEVKTAWREYKTENQIEPKPRSNKRDKSWSEEPKEISRDQLKTEKGGSKRVLKVKAPPKGQVVKISYEKDQNYKKKREHKPLPGEETNDKEEVERLKKEIERLKGKSKRSKVVEYVTDSSDSENNNSD